MERSKNKGIRIWFWSRNDPNVPPEIKEPFDTIEPNSSWGDPEAHFPVETCDYNSHFNDHRLIFDTTLCVSHSLSHFHRHLRPLIVFFRVIGQVQRFKTQDVVAVRVKTVSSQ